jgi:hypothetical protein
MTTRRPPLRPLGIRWDGRRTGVATYTGPDGRAQRFMDRLGIVMRHMAICHLSGWASEFQVRILRPHGRAEHGAWHRLVMTDELALEVIRRSTINPRDAERHIERMLSRRAAKQVDTAD